MNRPPLRRALLATATVLALVPMLSQAKCDRLNQVKAGEINIVGNSFPAPQHIA